MTLDSTSPALDMTRPIARLEDVWVAFASHSGPQPSLSGVTLDVFPGQWIALLGHNGSGKSTVGKVIAGLCNISKGHVEFSKPDVRIRLVFQNPESQAIGETVWEDVCFQPGEGGIHTLEDIEAGARHALRTVELEGVRNQRIESLSGGQKQRLAIAAAIARPVDLLIFDEATSMLDDVNRQRIWHTAKALHARGTSVIWITQHMVEVPLANQVVVLKEGNLVYTGWPEDFFYPASPSECSVCELMGFDPPYTIRLGRALTQRGVMMSQLPLEPSDLQRSLGSLCLSSYAD